ncbi:hypothetical protein HPB48_006106 [Haemaphysalis longicornis]|uniref:CCHC-type domain-containing protein n=1 Tax=Haemaphysalis longicornis TaxID=44386 RepID=A0A9J6GXB9_HAELO|nr:hypothetical protein HPB48_006106 [Haemaphysalis longicornis]
MMGETESVLITFEGTHVPHNVLFRRVLYRCKPERPNALKCNRCREYGHRMLNCPHPPTYQRCPTCSTSSTHRMNRIVAPPIASTAEETIRPLTTPAPYKSSKTKRATKPHTSAGKASGSSWKHHNQKNTKN